METKDYIFSIYNLARLAGLCRTQQEFAALIGVDRTTMSAALSGKEKYATKSLEGRVRLFAKAHHLDENQPAEPAKTSTEKGVFLPEETRQMFENLTETIKLQARLLDRLQGGETHSSTLGISAPKNFSHK